MEMRLEVWTYVIWTGLIERWRRRQKRMNRCRIRRKTDCQKGNGKKDKGLEKEGMNERN